jgi:Electron transfer DM13
MKTSPLLALTALLLACNTSSITPPTDTLVSSGAFYAVAHAGMGKASVFRMPSGEHVVKLENFSVDNGPLLEVYLSSAVNPTDSKSVSSAAYVNLGALKSISGDQTYAVPSGTDLTKFKSVVVWCTEFSVNFISAALQ